MDKNNSGQPLELSKAEQKLVKQMRRWQDESGTAPMLATFVCVDGIWQIWQGVPRGTMKGE